MSHPDSSQSFHTTSLLPLAIVIEPRFDLAESVHDVLRDMGFFVEMCVTHAGAARATENRCPHLLVACVPAPADDSPVAWLAEWRQVLGTLPTVLMLSDSSPAGNTPSDAVGLRKPFTRAELQLAVEIALSTSADVH